MVGVPRRGVARTVTFSEHGALRNLMTAISAGPPGLFWVCQGQQGAERLDHSQIIFSMRCLEQMPVRWTHEPMNIANIHKTTSWFEVLQTTTQSQTAAMTLIPGGETGPHAESHEKSDQAILMVSGRMKGEVGYTSVSLEAGDVIIIPAGTPHRFVNDGEVPALSFSVYSPPEYAADEKG